MLSAHPCPNLTAGKFLGKGKFKAGIKKGVKGYYTFHAFSQAYGS
jgi:hypothetical protein